MKRVPALELRGALLASVDQEAQAIADIEAFFLHLPACKRSRQSLACWFHSWRATHLKMLAIYGLSCRLQRLASEREGDQARALLETAALNAKTSYEDLGLDFDGVTHAALYDDFADAFVNDDSWKLARHGLPEALDFGKWVYRNMVVEPVEIGLLTNLFSEAYNHAEYTLAYQAFARLIDTHHDFTATKRTRALTYIQAHLEANTEVDHFHSVLEALGCYAEATGTRVDIERAQTLFCTYLRQLGTIMAKLNVRLEIAA